MHLHSYIDFCRLHRKHQVARFYVRQGLLGSSSRKPEARAPNQAVRAAAFLACWVWVSCLLAAPAARAQSVPGSSGAELTGTAAPSQIVPVHPSRRLDETCVVAVLNRTTNVNHDGTWILPNIPANFGAVRARATCVRNGQTLFGQSDPFSVGPNQSVTLPAITLGNTTPIPVSINVSAPATTLTQVAQTVQLTAIGTYAGGSTQDITAASAGTQYRTSNSAIATVSPDGLVTAVSSGTVVVQALNEGAQGITSVHVVLAGASDGGIPDDWALAHGLDPHDPAMPFEDPDNDGLTNLQEFQNGTDPHNPDTDGDGLTDGQEVLVYHTNPLLVSTDGTGIPDAIEAQTGTIGASLSAKLAKALASITLSPTTFLLTVNSLTNEASQQLTVTGNLIDGKTTLDLTSTQKGTQYSSNNLTVCNFGAPDGNVFAGNTGTCTITVTNNGFTATASGTVAGFTPTVLASLSIPGFANSVAVNGNYAYVAAGSTGLQVIDATNRSNPAIAASLPLPGNANGLKVIGNRVFVAGGSAGLHAIDASNPLAPTLLGTISTSGTALDLDVQGSIAYVANTTGLVLINVANPSVMSSISSLPLSGQIRGVSVDPQRGLAVVAAAANGVYIVDVSSPASPALRAQLSPGISRQTAIKGTFAFSADFGNPPPYLNSLVSIDTSSPSSPTLLSSIANETLGGDLNDLVISGNLALGADGLGFGIPITDISDPTNLRPRAILTLPLNPQGTKDHGMGLAVDGTYVYMTTDANTTDKFASSGTGRLYIGQYQVLQDTAGIPPVVSIASPQAASNVVRGSYLPITVNATDDVAVAAVNIQVNGVTVFTGTVAPYTFYYPVPSTATTLTIGATAVDYGGNVGTAQNISVNAIPDPGTTVIGTVVDGTGTPLSGMTASALGKSALTGIDGTFSIVGVPALPGTVTVTASGVAGGFVQIGHSAPVPSVLGGTTNVGTITTAKRPFVIISSTTGAVSGLDTSETPPTLVAATQPAGGQGASVTPDGSKALVSGGNVIRVYDLTKTPPTYIGDVGLSGLSTTMTAITSDSAFAVAPIGDSSATSINVATEKIIGGVNLSFASSVAITPDNTTVIASDNNQTDNYFRILSFSPQGVLADTGKTVPYKFGTWSPGVAIAPNGHFGLTANPDGNYLAILRIDAQHNVTLDPTTISMCCNPWGIAITPDGTRAYVTVGQSNSIAILNIDASDNITDSGIRLPIANGIEAARVHGSQGNMGIAIGLDGKAYIANTVFDTATQQGTITILDTNTNTVIGTIAVSGLAVGIGVPR